MFRVNVSHLQRSKDYFAYLELHPRLYRLPALRLKKKWTYRALFTPSQERYMGRSNSLSHRDRGL